MADFDFGAIASQILEQRGIDTTDTNSILAGIASKNIQGAYDLVKGESPVQPQNPTVSPTPYSMAQKSRAASDKLQGFISNYGVYIAAGLGALILFKALKR